jgi:hypothetical protein
MKGGRVMKLTWQTAPDGLRTGLTVDRDNGPKIYRESALWYAIKKELANQGLRFVKKRPDKDGYLTDAPFYLRAPRGEMAIWDSSYAVRAAFVAYNAGCVKLEVIQ